MTSFEELWKLGLTQWNLSRFEFKFDDTRISSQNKNKIGPIKKTMLLPDVALSLPCWLSQFSWDSQQGRDGAVLGPNIFF